ncbi:MAG: sulfatase-like hydrolase/transferase [Planctomycetaceae bacterium]|jgi:N-acetylgalactosamine-6-sulfatase|nr:sulfatase-like hydrolase/transferase [Planctomycetaceae bacterium]
MKKSILLTVIMLFTAITNSLFAGDKPNILFLLADDLGWGDLGCYGNTRIKTPSLDRLAREGTRFTQYYQGGSVCSPSRSTLTTGRLPAELKIHGHYATAKQNAARGMGNFLDPSVATLPRLLQQEGYQTAHIGKWHLGLPPDTPEDEKALQIYGFDKVFWLNSQQNVDGKLVRLGQPENRPRAAKTLVDAAINVLDTAEKNKPFFVQLWFNDPHASLAPSEEQRKPYRAPATPDGFTSPIEVYAGTVTELDKQIGRLLDHLEESGLAKNTIVIFSSDNGPEDIAIANASWSGVGSAGPFRGRKRSLYEGGIRLPFIVRWHGNVPAGQINNNSIISGADLLPTLTAAAGITLPEDVQSVQRGENVIAAFRGDKNFQRTKPLYWEWRFNIANHLWNRSPILAIREGQWKLLLNPDKSRVELYDIPNDPGEQNNLAEKYPDVVTRLSEIVLAWQKTLPEGPYEPSAGKNDYPWPKEK